MFDFDAYLEREARKDWSENDLREYGLLQDYYDRLISEDEVEEYSGKTVEELERIYN